MLRVLFCQYAERGNTILHAGFVRGVKACETCLIWGRGGVQGWLTCFCCYSSRIRVGDDRSKFGHLVWDFAFSNRPRFERGGALKNKQQSTIPCRVVFAVVVVVVVYGGTMYVLETVSSFGINRTRWGRGVLDVSVQSVFFSEASTNVSGLTPLLPSPNRVSFNSACVVWCGYRFICLSRTP